MLTTPPDLKPFLGKNIKDICTFSLGKDDGANHCAHFVSHVMGYDFGHTCKNANWTDKHSDRQGATIRVDEIFKACPEVSPWNNVPFNPGSSLIFVTISGNVTKSPDGRLLMKQGINKHVGIYINGQIWNYSNKQDKVVADSEIMFKQKFEHGYRTAGNTVVFYSGAFLK